MTAGATGPGGPVRIAIVGAGAIAERVHIPILRALAGVELVGLVEQDAARRDALRARWPDTPGYPDLEALERAGPPEAVLVATPPAHHLAPALWARDRGLHLYLEKPVAASTIDVESIVDAWRETGRVAAVGLNYRFHPGVTDLATRLAAGAVGRPAAIRTMFASPAPGGGTWRESADAGGGALADLGSHHLDLIEFVMGATITEVGCEIGSRRTPGDTAAVTGTLSNGCPFHSFFAFGACETDRIEVVGEEGSLSLDRLTGTLGHRPLRHRYGRLAALRRAPGVVRTSLLDVVRAPGEPSYRIALSSFVSAIRGGAAPLPGLEDGAHAHFLVEAAAASSREGRRIVVPPPRTPTPRRSTAGGSTAGGPTAGGDSVRSIGPAGPG